MKFEKTKIEGLLSISVDEFQDDRGSFFRTFCKKEFVNQGLDIEFVQINHSINKKKGTFRGFHFQKYPSSDSKLIRCVSGKVLDILVDIRKDSKTFLDYIKIELSEENNKLVYVPEGVAHGFISLEDNSHLIYHHTAFYDPKSEGSVNYLDPKIGIKLPIPIESISDKDLQAPFLNSNFNGI